MAWLPKPPRGLPSQSSRPSISAQRSANCFHRRSPAVCSGVWVALARAIARDPEILFFDEPTTGLDPMMSDAISSLIVKSVSALGATAISITHDMATARKIGHRVAMLSEAKIIWQGPVAEMDHSGNAYLEKFISGHA